MGVKEPIHVISLGAGVQSSTMALMAAKGEITPMPVGAIFSDTGAEPKSVYDFLEFLEKELPFPVHKVMEKEGLTKHIEHGQTAGARIATLPFFTETVGDKPKGMMRRQCTNEFKIKPISRKLRELVGLKKGQRGGNETRVVQWIGISLDEIQRMRDSHLKWAEHRWPLIDLRMKRHDCLRWMEKNGYPKPPRSACTYCPFHSDDEWKRMKDNDPQSWTEACDMDKMIRHGVKGAKEKLFLHPTLVPLEEVDLATDVDKGQGLLWNDMNQECEGMCGV